MIRPQLPLASLSGEVKKIRLRDHFNNPDILMKKAHFVDELTTGLTFTPMSKYDSRLTEELTNHLFEERNRPFSGLDLAAINIQRGRDHGIESYIKYFQLCQEELYGHSINIKSFSQVSNSTKKAAPR